MVPLLLGWLYLAGGIVTVPGCAMVIMAGQAERRGSLERARRDVRRGGFLMAAGAVIQALPGVVSLALVGISSPEAVSLSASATTILAAGCAGLLAGLSGKPRPTGYLAAVLVVASAVAWIASR
jgi:putative Mn2+ efflux pump MntP